jgi:hypothetical protein
LQQLKDADIQPLCANLSRFKRVKKINLVSRGECEGGHDKRVKWGLHAWSVVVNATGCLGLAKHVMACDADVEWFDWCGRSLYCRGLEWQLQCNGDWHGQLKQVSVVIVGLTFVEQRGVKGISDAVKRQIDALVNRNKDEPKQRLADVAGIKEVQ